MLKNSAKLVAGLVSVMMVSLVTIVSIPAIGNAQSPDEADTSFVLPGANDWDCKPSEKHPRPVVLVHGTWSDPVTTWTTLSPQLAAEGYCVFALEYGRTGSLLGGNALGLVGGDDIPKSALELARFVDDVRASTGAAQVDIVGHSLGGTLTRQYLRFAGGADHWDPSKNKVHTLVTLGATNHGSSFGGKQTLSAIAEAFGLPMSDLALTAVGPSFFQQMIGSAFLQALNAGGDTDAGVNYAVLASRGDEVSTPPEATFLNAGPGATVDNVWVQEGCEDVKVTHQELTSAPRAVALILAALDPSYTDTHPLPC
ncbi:MULTISPECIES: esterase/lipase family protein [Rhodococcus]|nr:MULTISPECIES: alpha/beta fold hydrolase [Rhodococcus]